MESSTLPPVIPPHVIPAQAGIQLLRAERGNTDSMRRRRGVNWIPACAGMTQK